MDIEFHFYITYYLARNAGFNSDEAFIVAYSSQYTDDNDTIYRIEGGKEGEYSNYISQTKDIFKPQEEFMRIYPVFHFMPGTQEEILHDSACRRDGKLHLLNTIVDSSNSRKILDEAFKTGNLYRIGIATHMYADTFAHQNFVGFKDTFNDMKGFLETFIPSIGHGDAKLQPDTVGLLWKDERLVSSHAIVDNRSRFLDAARSIYGKFTSHLGVKGDTETILKEIEYAMNIREKDQRVKKYMKLIREDVTYDETRWIEDALQIVDRKRSIGSIDGSIEADEVLYTWKKGYKNSHWYQFQEAIKAHQRLVMDMVLREIFTKIEYTGK
ncbi:MAG: hypothetical protein N2745_01645 [Syntrophorhabdaceae bacterium]|nr:hypothetical protein [Syntrophorhabdaceae bacterium]